MTLFKKSIKLFLISSLFFIVNLSFGQLKSLGEKPMEQKGKRAAIIFANQNYDNNKYVLSKTLQDAIEMKRTLEFLGFDILLFKTDLKRPDFLKALFEVENKLKNYDLVFFYYSGHGLEKDGINYMVPVDFPEISDTREIPETCNNLKSVFEILKNNKSTIFAIDACRNIPFAKGGGFDGLKIPSFVPEGNFTMFATKPGQFALENPNGKNSYFTQELVKQLVIPDHDINSIFRKTSKRVRALTDDRQQPSSVSDLLDPLVLLTTKTPKNIELSIEKETLMNELKPMPSLKSETPQSIVDIKKTNYNFSTSMPTYRTTYIERRTDTTFFSHVFNLKNQYNSKQNFARLGYGHSRRKYLDQYSAEALISVYHNFLYETNFHIWKCISAGINTGFTFNGSTTFYDGEDWSAPPYSTKFEGQYEYLQTSLGGNINLDLFFHPRSKTSLSLGLTGVLISSWFERDLDSYRSNILNDKVDLEKNIALSETFYLKNSRWGLGLKSELVFEPVLPNPYNFLSVPYHRGSFFVTFNY